eukprot:403366679
MAEPGQLTGFEREVDYYGLLNISKDASTDQIQKKFRKLSLYTHPDKTQGLPSQEIFVQMQKAYAYLTNPTTRIIYDNYGTQGLKVYEMFMDEFSELSNELRDQEIDVTHKLIIQSKILRKSKSLIRNHLKNQINNEYQKHFMIEFGMNMKSFCNNYHHFYHAGQLGQSIKLIRSKSLIGSVNFSLPLPKSKHSLDFQVMSQNDLRKGLGNIINVKDNEYGYTNELGKKFFNNSLFLKLRTTFTRNGIMPALSFSSSQLAPFMIDGSYNLSNDSIGFGIRRDVKGNSGFGYQLHLSMSEDDVTVAPHLIFQVSKDITLSSQFSISHKGNVTASIGVNYNYSQQQASGVFFQSNCQDFGRQLDSTGIVLVYNHYGYLFKVPIVTCNHQENKAGMIMTAGICVASNILFYMVYRKMKLSKRKAKKREDDVAFQRFYTKSEQVKTYLRENLMFYECSYNNETRTRGLVIIEAYYGLADHVYQMEAGLLLYKIPENGQEYSKYQLLPVTKQLQMQVQNGQLILENDFESLRGIFNPCINLKSKRLLYLRYKYREMENVLIYDFSRRELVVPRDVL